MSARQKASLVIMFLYVSSFLRHPKVLYQSKTLPTFYSFIIHKASLVIIRFSASSPSSVAIKAWSKRISNVHSKLYSPRIHFFSIKLGRFVMLRNFSGSHSCKGLQKLIIYRFLSYPFKSIIILFLLTSLDIFIAIQNEAPRALKNRKMIMAA